MLGMTAPERSLLLYLLESIDCEHDKTTALLKLASKEKASCCYRDALEQLRRANAEGQVLAKSKEILVSLR